MPTPTAFQDFLVYTRNAAYGDYVGRPGVLVASAEEFGAMQTYILERYAAIQAVGSFVVDNQTFDCIVIEAGVSIELSPDDDTCPDGTIPMRRITLEEMTRFRTVRDFLGKSPG
jgi:hypothetical protein